MGMKTFFDELKSNKPYILLNQIVNKNATEIDYQKVHLNSQSLNANSLHWFCLNFSVVGSTIMLFVIV